MKIETEKLPKVSNEDFILLTMFTKLALFLLCIENFSNS